MPLSGKSEETRPQPSKIHFWKILPILAGFFGVFFLMARTGSLRFGVPLGLVSIACLSFGILWLFGTFDPAETSQGSSKEESESAKSSTETEVSLGVIAFGEFYRPFFLLIAALLCFLASLMGGQYGWGHPFFWGAFVTLSFVATVKCAWDLGVSVGIWKVDRGKKTTELFRRHGFWLFTLCAMLYFPAMGAHSLIDPWETHYGEVAREILARDDWISLWWAQDGWFWSKPILNFWIQALSMSTLGTHYQPGQMLMGASGAPVARPEWVVRAPNVLFSIFALYVLYKGTSKVFGKRAGFFGAMVLATVPDWYFITHQTMADMPCVAPMTMAMGLLLYGLNTGDETLMRRHGIRIGRNIFSFSFWHLVFFAIMMVALPQAIYLLSRNFHISSDLIGFRFDEFRSGSGGGNCGLPGNDACRTQTPAILPHSSRSEGVGAAMAHFFLGFEPFLQGLLWLAVLLLAVYLERKERRLKPLLYVAAWFFCALAVMGKGPMGVVIPGICALAYVITTKRWVELLRMELFVGCLVLASVALPWYVSMYVRHGSGFIDRLIFHDMINRTLSHVHDTNEGIDTSFRFYIWQLGYALFPWIGLAPLALIFWARRSDSEEEGKADACVFLVMWFIFSFGLFSFMGTKFHHYIFPAVPPIAVLIGITLSDLFLATDAKAPSGSPVFISHLNKSTGTGYEKMMLGVGAFSGTFPLLLVTRDLYVKDGNQPGPARFIQLFTYLYNRLWPDYLDYTLIVAVAGGLVALLLILLSVPKLRRYTVVALFGVCFAFAAWGLDVYFVQLAPHWGQREVIQAYYKDRKKISEPLIAYQMNWKGENFYSGNQISTFVQSGQKFKDYIKEQKTKGVHVLYFVTEHSRLSGLKSELAPKTFKEITDKKLCNKFLVVRAEI